MARYSFLQLFSLCLCGAVSASGGDRAASDPAFHWLPVPATAVLQPISAWRSERFELVSAEGNRLVVAFKGPAGFEDYDQGRTRFRCVAIVPPGGIEAQTPTLGPLVHLKKGEPAQPNEPSDEPEGQPRFTVNELGEFRGARLLEIEFRPLVTARGRRDFDHFWIRDATLALDLTQPFGAARQLSALFSDPLSSVVLNPESIPLCFGPPQTATASPTLDRWRGERLKLKTRDRGWYSFSAGEMVAKGGDAIPLSEIALFQRGLGFSLPPEWREVSEAVPSEDVARTVFVLDASGEIRKEGFLLPTDRLLFHAEVSTQPYDPENAYWLVREATPAATPETAPVAATQTARIRTARIQARLGLDREFLEGGDKNAQQADFWIDRPFPEGATATLDLTLPEWVRDRSRVQGKIRLLFGSPDAKKYTSPTPFKRNFFLMKLGQEALPFTYAEEAAGHGWEVDFEWAGPIETTTLSLSYRPNRPSASPLCFDTLLLSSTQALVWSGTDVFFDFSTPQRGSFEFLTDSTLAPRYAFGQTPEGKWVSLVAESRSPLVFRSEAPLVALHLMAGVPGREPAASWRTWPQWVDEPASCQGFILSPREFRDLCQELVSLHQKEGFVSTWIELEDLYDLFAGGRFSPYAVRTFLSWVALTWPQPQPAAVCLVGDSRWDAWGRFPESAMIPNWTPSYHVDRDPSYPSDLWFVEGKRGDVVADWLWGRLPCQTPQQLQGFLGKLRGYLDHKHEPWGRRLLWMTDDNHPVDTLTEDIFRETLPFKTRLNHLQVRDFAFVDNFYYGRHLPRIQEEAKKISRSLDFGKISPDANQALRDALSEGVGMFVYYGHSGPNVLAHERVLFGGGSLYSDVPTLHNGYRAPFAILMTCDVGRFDFAEIAKWSIGLAEELLFHPAGGCLGLLVSTGKGLPSDHQPMLQGTMDAVYNRGITHLGALHWAARIDSLVSNGPNPALDMFTLLGDPFFEVPFAGPPYGVEARRLRWNREGSLEVEIRVPVSEESRPTRADAWQIASDLSVDWTWSAEPVDAEGNLRLILPDARDLDRLLLGLEVSGSNLEGSPVLLGNAALGIDLAAVSPQPAWDAELASASPNLSLTTESIQFENEFPMVGQTVFVQVRVRNLGPGFAREVAVEAREKGQTVPAPSFADYPPAVIPGLAPGEERSVRLRWDRWQERGPQTLEVLVDPKNLIAETDETDNQASRTLVVRGKPDLAWGLVPDSTSPVDFSQAVPVPAGWILQPASSDLKFWEALRRPLSQADRAAQIAVPLTNFGETPSATCSLQFSYWRDDDPEAEPWPVSLKIGPTQPTLKPGAFAGKKVPVLLIPGYARIEVQADPLGLVDEESRDNNRLKIEVPEGFWDRFTKLEN